jgi:integrase
MAGLGRLNRSPLTPKSVLLLDVRDVHGAACVCTSGQRAALIEAAAIGVQGLQPHELRHTASRAIAAGANIKVVQTMLGHKSATMTLDLQLSRPEFGRRAV